MSLKFLCEDYSQALILISEFVMTFVIFTFHVSCSFEQSTFQIKLDS